MDTRSKRASAVACAVAWAMAVPLPDGTIAQGDRQHAALCYSGISSSAPAVVEVAVDSHGVNLPVAGSGPARFATLTPVASVASPTAAATLLAEQSSRVKFLIMNDSTQVLYVKFGPTATASDFSFKLTSGQLYESPATVYTGIVSGLWASANGYARVTSLAEQV